MGQGGKFEMSRPILDFCSFVLLMPSSRDSDTDEMCTVEGIFFFGKLHYYTASCHMTTDCITIIFDNLEANFVADEMSIITLP